MNHFLVLILTFLSSCKLSWQLKISHFSVSAGRQVHVEATGGDITSIVSPSWPIRRRQTKETELWFSSRHINTEHGVSECLNPDRSLSKSSVFSDLKGCWRAYRGWFSTRGSCWVTFQHATLTQVFHSWNDGPRTILSRLPASCRTRKLSCWRETYDVAVACFFGARSPF